MTLPFFLHSRLIIFKMQSKTIYFLIYFLKTMCSNLLILGLLECRKRDLNFCYYPYFTMFVGLKDLLLIYSTSNDSTSEQISSNSAFLSSFLVRENIYDSNVVLKSVCPETRQIVSRSIPLAII